jgi:hypothetical protein
MKKPTGSCKHAQFEREQKWHYSQREKDESVDCWVCGGELTLIPKKMRTIEEVNMDDALRKDCANDEATKQAVLEMANRTEYVCMPCQKKRLEGFKNIKKEEWIPFNEVTERFSYVAHLQEMIKEVEECSADCPYRDRLASWRKNIAEA